MGKLLQPVLGKPFPDILYDGMVDPQKMVDGKLPDALQHSIVNNGNATFVNFNLPALTPANIATGKYRLGRDLKPFQRTLQPLPAVQLSAHGPPAAQHDLARQVYQQAPRRLSEYRLFQGDPHQQQPADGVIPYDLNTPLFSDHTSKFRFIKLPADQHIDYRADGVFHFPDGTIIAKTFAYPEDFRKPDGPRRLLETRIELKQGEHWYGYAYVWNQQQTEATLALGGDELEVSWTDAQGSPTTINYEIPNANQCLNCHSQSGEFVPLGPTANNMNRLYSFAHGEENQLDYLSRLAALAAAPPSSEIAKLPRWDAPRGRHHDPTSSGVAACQLRALPPSSRFGTYVGTGFALKPARTGKIRSVQTSGGRRSWLGRQEVRHRTRQTGRIDPAVPHRIAGSQHSHAQRRAQTGTDRRSSIGA